MKQLYLITGFLGAGKTTFVNQSMEMFAGRRIGVIVNEFGKQGIDGQLISQKGYEVSEISNGSIFCVCRMDMFIDALCEAVRTDLDVLLVESSGLSNPSNMDQVLEKTQELAGEGFDYRGCICLVDAKNFRRVAHTAVVIPDQIREASLIVVNKIDLVSPQELGETEREIRTWNQQCPIIYTSYSKIPAEALEKLQPLTPDRSGMSRVDISSAQLTVRFDSQLTKEQLQQLVKALEPLVYRCKGYVDTDQGCLFVDGVMDQISVTQAQGREESVLVCLYRASCPVRKTVEQFCSANHLGFAVL